MLRLLLLAILFLSNAYIPPALAAEPAGTVAASSDELKDIDRELMLRLIDLARFNINFHQTANRHQPWRDWTYPIAREAGTSMTLSNVLIDLRSRAVGLDNPKKVSGLDVEDGNICGTIGGAIGGTASTLELVQNAMVQLHARSLGYSPRSSFVHVLNEARRIDNLRERRAALVEQLTKPNERRVRVLESVLFHEIEEQLLFEFRKWNCYSRELMWRENVFFAIDAGQAYTSMTSALLGVLARTHPHLRGPSSITALISGCGATLSPIIADAAGNLIERHQRIKLTKYFPLTKPALPADVSMESINALRSGQETGEDINLSHASLLASNALIMDKALSNDVRSIQKLRQVAQQQAISGPLIGLASVARGTLTTVADYSYYRNSLISNRLKFAGRIPQAVGQSSAIVLTAWTKYASVKNDRELRRRHALPAQIFAARLKKLDDLEATVRSEKF